MASTSPGGTLSLISPPKPTPVGPAGTYCPGAGVSGRISSERTGEDDERGTGDLHPNGTPDDVPASPPDEPDIQVFAEGEVARRNVDYALRRMRPVMAQVDEPVTFARVKLSQSSTAQPRQARAQVVVDIGGDLVRAQVASETMTGAVDMLKDRLRDQLKRRSERRAASRRHPPQSGRGTWRRGDLPGRDPVYYHRPAAERELVRRKTFSIGETTAEEAAADMDQLDHDFFLFREAVTGTDALVFRKDDGTHALVRLRPSPNAPVPAIEVADTVPPRIPLESALARIGVTGERYLFFENAQTGRGNVLYRRFDGHYGLINPA